MNMYIEGGAEGGREGGNERAPPEPDAIVQPIPAYMRLLFSKGIPYFLLPNLDSVNHCTSKEISMEIKRYLLVQWLTESRFGK